MNIEGNLNVFIIVATVFACGFVFFLIRRNSQKQSLDKIQPSKKTEVEKQIEGNRIAPHQEFSSKTNLENEAVKKSAPPKLESEDFASAERITGATDTSSLSLTAATVAEPETTKTLQSALVKSQAQFFGRIKDIFKSRANEQAKEHLSEIEEILYTSDIGPSTVQRLMEALEINLSKHEKSNIDNIRALLNSEMNQIFNFIPEPQSSDESLLDCLRKAPAGTPTVFMVVGINGAGKTTSIGKIAAQLAISGKKVLVAAGDTFRAAAGGQLKVWTDRAQVDIYAPVGITDPSAVAFDAIAKAKTQNYDVVIIDTAGRLHTQSNLMEELKKIKRVISKGSADAPHEILIVLDANSGQNALVQAKEFHKALGLTGAILTKMDGTAKGGVAIGLANDLKLPIKFVGLGEKIGDLKKFSSQEFIDSMLK